MKRRAGAAGDLSNSIATSVENCPRPRPHFDNGTSLDPPRRGAIDCAIEQISELGENDLNEMTREAKAPSEIHPNLNEWR
jgi:hypothetical protein